MKARLAELEALYRDALLQNVIPFWERYSVDRECGGYYTCLNRSGDVYDKDKFVWLQAREIWTFSMLYNRLEKRDNWLDIARHGALFLKKHGRDKYGNWYFALDQHGNPLVQAYNIFSDCFASVAFGEYALAAGDGDAKEIALGTFRNILRREENPKGKYSKIVPGTRPLKSLAFAMILVNLSSEMEWLLERNSFNETIDTYLDEVMKLFLDDERKLVFEYVSPDGSHPDCFDGRLINPGHSIEAMWFIMDIAHRRNDRTLVDKTVDLILSILNFGWDREYGGIYYFLDAEGKPPQQLEWSQKLWWVHLESLVALAKGYALTGRAECWEWYEKVHEYTWQHFPDPEYDEWFGYFDRRGERLLDLKGGKWKGCFHLPRALYLCYTEFHKMNNAKQPSGRS